MLIRDVKDICDTMGPKGWQKLIWNLSGEQIDIIQPTLNKLENELLKSITLPDSLFDEDGFKDLSKRTSSAITPGRPAESLLYHALASPLVHPTSSRKPVKDNSRYPTWLQLDTIENYIYSHNSDQINPNDFVLAVFAYQYRPFNRTSHGKYADMAYSRTGVSRIGTSRAFYNGSRRGYWPVRNNNPDNIAVLPSRFGAFLAERGNPNNLGSVRGKHPAVGSVDFLFPRHKLFDGKECIKGLDLELNFLEFHRNDKLQKIHDPAAGKLPQISGFDISRPPFNRDSDNGGDLVSLKKEGSTRIVVPRPKRRLVETVSQFNEVTKKREMVRFKVPSSRKFGRLSGSSLIIPPTRSRERLAPEYVNIRHEVDLTADPEQTPLDLGDILPKSEYDKRMIEGGYFAAHFVDQSCDGVIALEVAKLSHLDNFAAFSLVTAPDFYPLADQMDLSLQRPTNALDKPLSLGDLPANLALLLPRKHGDASNRHSAFNASDKTVTAVVGDVPRISRKPLEFQDERAISFLPDGASNVFMPGWDVSTTLVGGQKCLSSSGLGSPFPEDVKLCAALGSFWPAAAPDNGRTFGNDNQGGPLSPLTNQLPMLSNELGYHPKDPRVTDHGFQSRVGWDGEYGPFFERVGGKLLVNYVDITRSDYVSHALSGSASLFGTANVTTADLVARNDDLRACFAGATGIDDTTCLVRLDAIENWSAENRGLSNLIGRGHYFEFATLKTPRRPTREKNRIRREVIEKIMCGVGERGTFQFKRQKP